MSKIIGMVGAPGTAGSVASLLGGMSERSREAMRNELTARRNLVNDIVQSLMKVNSFDLYNKLSNKELRKKSKEFMLVYRYMEPLQFHLYTVKNKIPSLAEVKRMSQTINALCNSKQFAQMDLEKVDTDYFEITLASYIAVKHVIDAFKKKRPDQKQAMDILVMVASELGLRIYDLYIDNRQDHASNEETVQFR